MIELSHLNKIYHTKSGDLHALKNIDLSVSQGEIVGVIGKSGAGKSTLIRCVNLLEKPTSGAVIVDGVDLMTLNKTQLRHARHQIGMIFQHFNLLSTLTVYDNVAFPLRLQNKNSHDIDQIIMPLIEKVGLMERCFSYPHQLSGGQKQRVAIARALASRPTILLCDEMTSSLDPETTDDILQLIRAINQEFKLSILCITHQMSVIKSIADRVAVIDNGEIVECANVLDIFKNPQAWVTKRLIQSAFKTELPEELQAQLQHERMHDDLVMLRLTFFDHATLEPIINEFMQQTHIKVNILQANIEQLKREMIGRMIIAIDLQNTKLEEVNNYLEKKGITVEVLGYVDRKTWVAR